MMFSPCCGVLMQNSRKPYDYIGQYRYMAMAGYKSSMPVWKCPKCSLKWAIERMV
jgi:hypothetical protein